MSGPDQGRPRTPKALLARLVDTAILKAHALAGRYEVIPDDFGHHGSVDETQARAVLAEWVRCARLWAGYNPEQIFALKVGAGLLLLLIVGLWLMVASINP